ncbi:MAG: ATP-binding protein [Deltaproteobacteria bacterium]|nr:ATP-binding protein [Deltaproteobacteria bacterium]
MAIYLDVFLDPAFSTDQDGRITYWNRQAEIRFGYPVDEVLGRHYSLLFPLQEGSPFPPSIEEEFQTTGRLILFKVEPCHKSGSVVQCELTRLLATPQNDNEKGTQVFVLRDVSGETALRREVQTQREKLFQLLQSGLTAKDQSGMQGIYEAILMAVVSGRGLRFNRAFLLVVNEAERVLQGALAIGPGSSEEAARIYTESPSFKNLAEEIAYYHSLDRQTDQQVNLMVGRLSIPMKGLASQWMETLMSRPYQVATPEILARDPGGPLHWISAHLQTDTFVAAPLVWQGMAIGLLVADNVITRQSILREEIHGLIPVAAAAAQAILDVRLLRQMEINTRRFQDASMELKKTQESILLHERLSSMGWLMAELTHEVRNPLVVVGGYVRRLLEKAEEFPSIQHEIEVIAGATEKLELILNRYADRVLTPEPKGGESDLNKVVESVISLTRQAMDARGVTIRFYPSASRMMCSLNDVQMFEVFYNLVTNAIHAMDQGGAIAVRLSRDGDRVHARVEDTGPGIPPDVLPHVFNPFFSTREKGLGLGLTLVKEIVENNGGKIKLETQPGHGTVITLILPA